MEVEEEEEEGKGGGQGGELKDREEKTLCLNTIVFFRATRGEKIKIDFFFQFSIAELT